MEEYIIETRGLTKNFGTVTAVKNLDLAVRRGEMVGMVGPDGAGKTTLIRMLCGIVEPDSGTAQVLGLSLPGERNEVKRHIGYLSQRFSLYGDLTIDENIEFFAEIHGVKEYKARREELLTFTRLAPFRTRLADKLSGGMKQKLALACALIHTPQIIFLDEPTTGVDPVSRRDFWKILSDLRREGITILMTTPYLDEAERCTRVGLMDQGGLMVMDEPGRLKTLMKDTILEVVVGEIRRALAVLRGRPGVTEVQAFGDRLNVVVEDRDKGIPMVKDILSQEEIPVENLRVVPPSLENIFIYLVSQGQERGHDGAH